MMGNPPLPLGGGSAGGVEAMAAASFLRRSNRLLASTPYFSQDRMAQRQQRRQRARDGEANANATDVTVGRQAMVRRAVRRRNVGISN